MQEASSAENEEVEVTPEEALRTAVSLHQTGRLDDAEALYGILLQALPHWPDALHFSGLLKHQRGDDAGAIASIAKALELAPAYADAHSNLGNIHKKAGRPQEAVACYQRALELQPDNAPTHNNLGLALNELHEYEKAIEHFRRAVEGMPQQAEFHYNLGRTYQQHDDFKNAADSFRTAMGLRPYCDKDYEGLCLTLYLAGEKEAAIPVVKQWLELDPEHPYARHRWASLTGQDVPERAADEYVRRHFDDFAKNFDYILQKLDYKAPSLIHDALGRLVPKPEPLLSILDAGCGTGLCSATLRPHARELVGVDLSEKMLAKAAERQDYDELVQAELTAFMNGHANRFDLIVSADTLCYFGDLTAVMAASRRALKDGGRLIFTVERMEPDTGTFGIEVHGRYSHGRSYVEKVLGESGFVSREITPELLRHEAGQPVNGWLVVAEV